MLQSEHHEADAADKGRSPVDTGPSAGSAPAGPASPRARRKAGGRGIAARKALLDAPTRCPRCGCEVEPDPGSMVKRGAVVITRDPLAVTWRGRPVPLSPVEAHLFASVAVRGRASYDAMDEALLKIGASPDTRGVVVFRIRQKFIALGASDPFERAGASGVRLVVDPDEKQSRSTIIGLKR